MTRVASGRGISLENFSQKPREYQEKAINRALTIDRQRLLLSSPTGTGKGTMQLGLLKRLLERGDEAVIVTPSLEVMRGYLERCGATPKDLQVSESKLAALGEKIRVWTPVRLRNALRAGKDLGFKRTGHWHVIVDEAHHAIEETISGGGLRELLPDATWTGFTATSYRGTPEETKALREAWGDPEVVLDIPGAVRIGAWSLPKFKVVPLVDDDKVGVKGGDLDADEIALETIDLLADYVSKTCRDQIPTCVILPSVAAACALHLELRDAHLMDCEIVTGETPGDERARIYEKAKKGTLLVSVKVLGEGVDFPWLRRLIDGRPTLSPVAFMQFLGRITRPGEIQPEYHGTNRNLERHGYLLQGLLPSEVLKEAQEVFGGPSTRGSRAGMIKAVAKIKPTVLPLLNGVKGTMWAFWEPDAQGGAGYERVIILDPLSDKVISVRHKKQTEAGKWDTYVEVPVPDKIEGISIAKTKGPASPNQAKWWSKSAWAVGLDPKIHPSKAQFLALPVLDTLGIRLGGSEDLKTDSQQAAASSPETFRRVYQKVEIPLRTAEGKVEKISAFAGPTGRIEGTRGGPEIQDIHHKEFVRRGPIVEADFSSIEKRIVAPGGSQGVPQSIPKVSGPSPVLKGYFTVVREDGRRTYRVETQDEKARFAPGQTILSLLVGPQNNADYQGLAFVDSQGPRLWKRHQEKRDWVVEDWKVISGDPTKAGKAYALESGNCYICGRLLTTPESIQSGIGPHCASKGGF